MNAGKRNCRVVIQSRAAGQSDLGQPVDNWKDVMSRWVAIHPLNGREYFAASGENSQVTTRIRADWDVELAAITNKHRINYGGKFYDIDTVINDKEQNNELIFMCKLNG